MLKRMLLLNVVLAAWGTSAVWGRAEFHIGGPTGASWQGLITDEQTEYILVDDQSAVLGTLPIAIGVEEVGVDTMIAYDDNAIQPIWVDPSVNLALDVNLTPRGGNLYTSVSTGYTREAAKEVQVMIDGDPETATLRQVDISPRLAGLNIGYVKNTVVNLGAEMPVNRIRFYPRPGFEENYLAWYEIGVANNTAPFMSSPQERAPGKRWYIDITRSLTATNDPEFDILERNVENLDHVVDLHFLTRDLRWVAIRPVNPERTLGDRRNGGVRGWLRHQDLLSHRRVGLWPPGGLEQDSLARRGARGHSARVAHVHRFHATAQFVLENRQHRQL